MIISRLKRALFCCLVLSLFPVFSPLQAAPSPWSGLTRALQTQMRNVNNPVGSIVMVKGAIAIIKLADQSITVGSTLAVKGSSLPGVPLNLQDNIARIRIIQLNNSMARGTIMPGSQKILVQSPVFLLSHNQIYLYTNLVVPQRLKAYQALTEALHYNHFSYTLKNWSQLGQGETPGINPLLIILTAAGNQVNCRLTDNDRNIFFQNSLSLKFEPLTTQKAGSGWSLRDDKQFSSINQQSFTKAANTDPGRRTIVKIKLKTPYKRLVFANYDKDPALELALLNHQWLEIYQLKNLKLIPITRFHLPQKDFLPLHLDAGDFNHNGRDEFYLTLGRPTIVVGKKDTFISSMILERQAGTIKILDRGISCYFRVIEQRDGKRVLLAQKMGEFQQYSGPICWGALVKDKFELHQEFRPSRNIFSLYNFNLSPFNKDHLLIVDERGNLAGFNAKNSERVLTADAQYGIFDESPYEQKLKDVEYEGGFSISKTADTRYSARRFIKRNDFQKQIFIIKKGRSVNPDLSLKALTMVNETEIRYDQIVGLQWRNEEIIESWKSPEFPRDIVDFAFTEDKGKEIMVVLTRNRDGKYALELLH